MDGEEASQMHGLIQKEYIGFEKPFTQLESFVQHADIVDQLPLPLPRNSSLRVFMKDLFDGKSMTDEEARQILAQSLKVTENGKVVDKGSWIELLRQTLLSPDIFSFFHHIDEKVVLSWDPEDLYEQLSSLVADEIPKNVLKLS